MEEIMNNVEVMENEDEVVNEIMPIEAETYDETSDESAMSKKDMVIGGIVLGFATAGAVALGRCAFKGCKTIIRKIKDKAAKKNVVAVPVTEAIDEQPVEVHIPQYTEEDEVVNETE